VVGLMDGVSMNRAHEALYGIPAAPCTQ
jgi:hypothetical protein